MTEPIRGFLGKRGYGKTLMMTLFGVAQAKKLQCPIYSNYTITADGIECKKMNLEFLREFFKPKSKKIPSPCVLLIDEMATFLDSYEGFSSEKSRYFTLFIGQTRKKNIIFMYTQQTIFRVPKSIRDLTEILIEPKYILSHDCVRYRIYDFDGVGKSFDKEMIIKNVSQFFSLYDTNEVVEVLSDG